MIRTLFFNLFFLRFYCAISVENEFMNWLESNVYLLDNCPMVCISHLPCLSSISLITVHEQSPSMSHGE